MTTVNQLLTAQYRCPDLEVDFAGPDADELLSDGYFRFGKDLVCYGRTRRMITKPSAAEELHDVCDEIAFGNGQCVLPFDAAEALENLRRERYVANGRSGFGEAPLQKLGRAFYYSARPILPVSVRRHFQRWVLTRRMKTNFPGWPVDRTADRLLEKLLGASMKAQEQQKIPFIWFWPDEYSSAAIMTHDVETDAGLRFCSALMDIDEEFCIPASFQIVPESRYTIPQSMLEEFRTRLFEINVHDLNHDGRLYWDYREFVRRAAKINAYARDFKAKGFRSGTLYRNLDWYEELDFAYDMSVPNVAHLDPQPGGCCTVMPFFVGHILELPVTTIQDYPLFHLLGDYSIQLWVRQIKMIQEGHGLASIISHPDYLQDSRSQRTYCELLNHLARLRADAGLWLARPAEVNEWWRLRSDMRLVQEKGQWRIEGNGRERARIAYAHLTEYGVYLEPFGHDSRGTQMDAPCGCSHCDNQEAATG